MLRFILIALGVSAAFLARFIYSADKPSDTKWAARVVEGKVPGFNDYLTSGFWATGVFGLVLCLALLATAYWWAPWVKHPAIRIAVSPEKPSASPRYFWLIILLAVVAGAVPRAMRLDHSLWGDEAWAAGDYTHGTFKPIEKNNRQGELEFAPTSWRHALFDDRGGGNNHVLMTALARVSSSIWRTATGSPRSHYSEAAMRVPVLIGGLLSIIAAACALRAAGLARAGLIAAWLFALHPWAVRYGSEARGYGLLLLGLFLAFWMLTRALESGQWRYWWGFAAADIIMLFSWAGAAHPVGVLALVGLGIIIGKTRFHPPTLVRWFFAHTVAASIFLVSYIPRHYQIVHCKERTTGFLTFPSNLHWWDNLTFHLLTGANLADRYPDLPHPNSLTDYFGGNSIWGAIAGLLGLAAIIFGFIILVRKNRSPFALILGSVFVAFLIAILHVSVIMGEGLLYFYMVYLLPALVLLAAITIAQLGRFIIPAIAMIFGLWSLPLHNAITIPAERLRDAWEVTRGQHETHYATAPSKVRTCYLWRSGEIYSPRAELHARTLPAIEQQMRLAREANDELYVTIGNLGFVYRTTPDLYALLEDPTAFEKVGEFPGVNPIVSLKCYRMKTASSQGSAQDQRRRRSAPSASPNPASNALPGSGTGAAD